MTDYIVVYKEDDDKLECMFSGSLNTFACMNIEKELKEHIKSVKGALVFNMHGVDFMASSFLRFCIIATKAIGKERFEVIGASSELKKIFSIAGMEKMLS